ncbi:SDR family NAD(P)-dependent oxidoreductase [Streptomyces sp. AV19]|uniref:type I polyketide synthase n=1 Tax=Streptomyces sp. AV19 TaxID=2793068 RepID=UPI0018FE9B37|nr:type I polyketide synthase [Streptomyces sp. AV19]MBH1932966.1 SDR family NAD(P)-dependent oxidoreductase [Streptomyces sp. AV19]MDG4533863.1 SDR family NAD(P)-dependent oxidoreductase [Streptomyces sp. AV19]
MVIGVSPFGEPDVRLAAAVSRAGGLGVIDLGSDDGAARDALDLARLWTPGAFGVRVPADCALRCDELRVSDGDGPQVVLVAPGFPLRGGEFRPGTVIAEVRGPREARTAVAAGAAGLVARGSECGGPAGELSTFILLQQLLGDERVTVPVWACGGIGPHTAAAAVLGGAAGVVLDVQLALLDEADTAPGLAAVLRLLDGTETHHLNGHRTLDPHRPGLPDTLRGRALPLGQDALLARRFARKYKTVAVAVRAVHDAVDRAGRDRNAPGALRPGSPMSRALGTELPVAQGPMTRVSDQPGFAAAVADAGGLPFLALALAGRERTRALIEGTRAALGDRPWGVGLLGFAPEDIRAAQLEAVRDLRPTHAVIAGGRPAHAADLEQHGIRTFLHVPSPGLLEQFLAAGARRFVFEGAECGGHIGPRNSFPLWEAQLAVLDDFLTEHPDQGRCTLEVLFAGGIHDERSAAMVAALASGIRARGVATGVLMGTAYLFTEEAVACDAIRPLYQRQALAAERTAVLRTGPGQATRCLPSPYCRTHEARREELSGRGVPDRQVWEELERLNLGRLRIAGKGVERVGDILRHVDERRQLDEGLFMAGEASVLRTVTTSVAALHRQVGEAAASFYEERSRAMALSTPPPPGGERPTPEPLGIAVIGMACVFPQAPDLPAFWSNMLAGTDAVTEVPAERWDASVHHGPQATAHDVSTSKWGGFLPRIPFDPLRYGIPPASLSAIEPVQLLALETAARALADAGYDRREMPRDRTCVIFGAEAGSEMSDAAALRAVLPSYLGRLPEELADRLPVLTEDTFPGMLGNVIAGRIANRLGLGGATYTVDAACASSLAAVEAACGQLRGGAADLALCGGADLHNGIKDYLLFSSVRVLSPTGRCRPFDADADGIALGEGVACLVLKRLEDADRDGDRVYAVIEAVGSSADGRSLGLTAPRREGQRAALERAYAQARVQPAEVGLVEAHGTGTAVGDHAELVTLTEVFTASGAAPGKCAVGSVKSQIGHTKCAAGLAGMVKAALALHRGVRPPTLHLRRPDPFWDPVTSPFVFHDRASPWARPAERRAAGVSAFGFGGTNFHVVLRGHGGTVPPRCGHDVWPAELLVLRGADDARELLRLTGLNDRSGRPWRLRDLALTAARRTGAHPVGAAVVAASLDELPTLLRAVVAGEPRQGVFLADRRGPAHSGEPGGPRPDTPDPGKIAVLFPGQGSQHPGMLAELFIAFPETQRHLRRVPADVLFPPAAFDAATREAQRARLAGTRHAQPALGAVCLAAHDVLKRLGVRAGMAAGHSYGELVALGAAGVLSSDAVLDLSAARAEAIAEAVGDEPGAMAVVAAEPEAVEELLVASGLKGKAVVANHNAPAQSVISGHLPAVEQALAAAADAGLAARRLPVSCAFHSPLVAGATEKFADALAGLPFRTADFPVWSNATADRYPEGPTGVRERLAEQIAAPVRFVEQIEAMYASGARVFVEAGPGTALTGLVRAVLGSRPHVAVPFAPHPDAGLAGHLQALARLSVAGATVAAERLFTGRDAIVADPAAVPEPAGWTVDGHLVRTADGAPLPGGLRPARRIGPLAPPPARTDGPDLLAEFLRGSREMMAAQRDVMLAYFGAGPERTAPGTPDVPPPPGPVPEPRTEATTTAVPDVLSVVRSVISERTGYPRELIEPGLDLEAELSIDSIKRTEIVGELGRRLTGATGPDRTAWAEPELEELLLARTAAALADRLTAALDGGCQEEPGEAAGPGEGPARHPGPGAVYSRPVAAPPGSCPPSPAPDAHPLHARTPVGATATARYLLREVPLAGAPEPDDSVLRGRRFLVLGEDTPLARALVGRLRALGAAARSDDHPGPDGSEARDDGVIHLAALVPGTTPVLPAAFPLLQAVLRGGPRWLLCARPAGEDIRTAGLGGFFRAVAREYPDTSARVVTLAPDRPVAALTEDLIGELLAPDRCPVVRHTAEGARLGPELYRAPLEPAADGDATAHALAAGLGPGSVALLTGGARGITARTAVTLAAAGCRVELLGRTDMSGAPEDPGPALAPDITALRSVLAGRGGLAPADIDREARRVLARREVAATLAGIAALGGQARYHCLDLRDAEAVRKTVDAVHADAGRVDAVVHAAGVVEDRLLADKQPESFERVHGTKVDGARALLSALRGLPEPPRLTVLFGSVAAVLGNRGQTDYSAANDALAALGRQWRRTTGRRALTVHWGPWAPDPHHPGMVGPELARDLTSRGLALIDPAEGVRALCRELAHGDADVDEVVLTAPGRLP